MANKWQSRIIGHGEEAPDQLLANPQNWRFHPKAQQDALQTVIDKIGWIQDVIVNQRTNTVIDGHLRVQLAISKGEASIPVVYVDLDEGEERLALATLDSTSHMAITDGEQLTALLKDIQDNDASLIELANSVAIEMGTVPANNPYDEWRGMPEFDNEDLQGIRLMVHFEKPEDRERFFNILGLSFTDKTNSIWFPERPEALKDQLGNNQRYSNES